MFRHLQNDSFFNKISKAAVDTNPAWKVIYCASRQEKKVAIRLEKMGIVHYMPLVKKMRQWKDRKKWLEMPLFNAYVFVQPTEIQRDQVLSLQGVVKYIRFNASDALVRDSDITLIRSIINKGYQLDQFNFSTVLAAGDLAEVIEGPFQGEEVEVFYLEGDSFVVVNIEGLCTSYKVNLPREVLKLKTKNKDREKSLW
ncbi:MAG: UpxY family transcription antiterminator [Flavobacteriaceae bacterium]|nr:UpxY family transcription antiterminator [Flavobacteriaceae bacterium]